MNEAMQRLIDFVLAATVPYRKGEVVKIRDGVTSIDAFPESHDAPADVDVHFITVGFTEAAAIPHHEFYELHELWQVVTPAKLGVTGELGDQLAGQGYVMAAGLQEPAVAQ